MTDHASVRRRSRLAVVRGGLVTFGVELLVVAGLALFATLVAVVALALD